jgi:hypothetical protein
MNFDVKNVTSAAEEQFGAKLLLSDKAVFTTTLSTAGGAVSGVDIRCNSYDVLMAVISQAVLGAITLFTLWRRGRVHVIEGDEKLTPY